MKAITKKTLAFIIAFVMVISMMPLNLFAEETVNGNGNDSPAAGDNLLSDSSDSSGKGGSDDISDPDDPPLLRNGSGTQYDLTGTSPDFGLTAQLLINDAAVSEGQLLQDGDNFNLILNWSLPNGTTFTTDDTSIPVLLDPPKTLVIVPPNKLTVGELTYSPFKSLPP